MNTLTLKETHVHAALRTAQVVEPTCPTCGIAHTLADDILRRDIPALMRQRPRLDAQTMRQELHDLLLFRTFPEADARRLTRTFHAVSRLTGQADAAGHGAIAL
jgi:hypothetical protein